MGDTGYLQSGLAKVEITDCRKSGDHHLHIGRVLSGEIKAGDTVAAEVDANVRAATALNHSATHLLHKALQEVLGDHVQQKGPWLIASDCALISPTAKRLPRSRFGRLSRSSMERSCATARLKPK